ncbi:MAG: RNA polymerase factor sigma-54 [Alphaproteobacteria bacterium]|nr:RNA polymerase factor sigma-54 [Alphaproteobacteria bacterium]
MALSQKLELRQGQSLVMTPQLQQAIKLLQLSNLELGAYVEQELERNPFLERDEGEPAERAPGEAPQEAGKAASESAGETALDVGLAAAAPPAEHSGELDTDFDNLYADRSRADAVNDAAAHREALAIDWSNARGGSTRFDDASMDFEESLTGAPSLRDHLNQQVGLLFEAGSDRLIASFLVDLVDEAGYLRADLGEIAGRLGAPPAKVEAVLARLQTLEPTGICARSLAECMKLQLVERNRFDPAMQALLANLELVARRDLGALSRLCGVETDDVLDMIEELKSLNPKPGLAFGHEPVQPVIPDVFVREGPQGAWLVELNTETLPRVLVNQRYYSEVASQSPSRESRTYVSECLTNANWLVRSLEQRATTILKVATEIVRQQDAFFIHGVQHLRPLNLKTVAEAIGMHESTVSRVTANKYLASKRGLFEMKYFFTSAIASADGGEAHSAEAVRHRIKELIDGEDAREILSDDRIVAILRSAGIDIARRTVAKYREAMRIPSSVQRRRLKALSA